MSRKTLLISKTLGIEGTKLLTPEDDFEAIKDFNAAYEGETTVLEELHLEYQRLIREHPDLEARLDGFPTAVFSGRAASLSGAPVGVFLCYRLPALDTLLDEFTLEAGTTRWYLFVLETGEILEDTSSIAQFIRSEAATGRVTAINRSELIAARDEVGKHIRNTYLKQVSAPIDAPKPRLVCWLELNEG